MKKKLSHMVREHIGDETQRDAGDAAEVFISYTSLPVGFPSVIQRFMDNDRTWNPENIINILWSYETQEMDTQIAKLQQVVDEISPIPGASRMKKIRKEKIREPALSQLKHLLAAKALRSVEHKRGLVDANGKMPIANSTIKSLPIHQWPSTPFYNDKLKKMRDTRLKLEKSEAKTARDQYMKSVDAQQKGTGFYGHWEFKNKEEEELVACVFMKSVKNEEATADDVFLQVMDAASPSVFHNIQLVWVPDPLIVKPAINPARLKALQESFEKTSKKRKRQPAPGGSSAYPASSTKMQKLRSSQEQEASIDDGDDKENRPHKLTRREERSTAEPFGEPPASNEMTLKATAVGTTSKSNYSEEPHVQIRGEKRKAAPALEGPRASSTAKRLKLIAPRSSCSQDRGNSEDADEDVDEKQLTEKASMEETVQESGAQERTASEEASIAELD